MGEVGTGCPVHAWALGSHFPRKFAPELSGPTFTSSNWGDRPAMTLGAISPMDGMVCTNYRPRARKSFYWRRPTSAHLSMAAFAWWLSLVHTA